MVRAITQEFFNKTVKENVEFLDLSPEDAIQETVEQFISQGVDLSNIVKDVKFILGENTVLTLMKELRECDPKDDQSLSKMTCVMEKIKVLCEKDIAYKCMFGNGGISNVLIDFVLSSDSKTGIKKCAFECLHSLLDGYPDLLDERGMDCILGLLSDDVCEEMQILAFKIITVSCIKHENNRQSFMKHGIVDKLKFYLREETKDGLVKQACSLPTVLTLDDDIRVTISQAHNHAAELATELLAPLIKLLKAKSETSILIIILNTLSSIVVRNEHCDAVYEQGGLEHSIIIIRNNRENQVLLTKCFKFLVAVVGSDEVRNSILKFDFAEELSSALNQFISIESLVGVCLRFISKLCLRSRENSRKLFDLDLPILIVQAMKVHSNNGSIQVSGCWAIRNMATRNTDLHWKFLEVGAEDVLNNFLKNHKNYEHDAKIALVELKCDVELQEPWTGNEGDKLKR